MDAYLESSQFIDWHEPSVLEKAQELALGKSDDYAIAHNCFEFVRDSILHSHDHGKDPVTAKASDVLFYATGYCYAKSHLLAALLRANKIPAALCYQRLSIDGKNEPYCIHGLNAVWLQNYGWYRIDARGNKSGVNAQFSPPVEQLAFSECIPGEYSIDGLFPEPWSEVVNILTTYSRECDVWCNLPDIPERLVNKS